MEVFDFVDIQLSSRQSNRTLAIGTGRTLKVTPVYDTYWRFAAKRQNLFMKRALGQLQPWTDDPVLQTFRFTNAYRASDRVSQYLIRNVIYEGGQSPEEVFFRTILFKVFNRIDTWETLCKNIGELTWKQYSFEKYSKVLDAENLRGKTIYSAAYIMPSPSFGYPKKHRNHLRLIEHMMKDGAPKRILSASSLESVFNILRGYPSLGDFLAFQFSIDLNYSDMLDFSEMDFVVAGPGAKDGIRKCFSDSSGLSERDLIRVMTDRAEEEFDAQGLEFKTLWGRPLQLIDCQNLFCEVDKYSRVVHPEYKGKTGRIRIKQKFTPLYLPLPQFYPPKWNLKLPKSLKS